MNKAPTFSITSERRTNLGNWEHQVLTVGLYSIPFNTAQHDIDAMIYEALSGVSRLDIDLRQRIRAIRMEDRNEKAFDTAPVDPANCAHHETTVRQDGSEICDDCGELIQIPTKITYRKPGEDIGPAESQVAPTTAEDDISLRESQVAPMTESDDIPFDHEVLIDRDVFGVHVATPPDFWHDEALTEVNSDGSGGGQLRALNAALTAIGHGGTKRHAACLRILKEYGPIGDCHCRHTLESTKDLSKAEAHIVLSFIENAKPEHLERLGEQKVKAGVR